jgi:hypothetical protein
MERSPTYEPFGISTFDLESWYGNFSNKPRQKRGRFLHPVLYLPGTCSSDRV